MCMGIAPSCPPYAHTRPAASRVVRCRAVGQSARRLRMDITRKRFVETMASGSVVLLFTSCGGGSDYNGGTPAPAPAPAPSGTTCSPAQISNNHPAPHALVIAKSDLDSTTPMTYDIHGTADHTHSVTFSAAQLAQLKAGTTVSMTSTMTFSHDHVVSVSCT